MEKLQSSMRFLQNMFLCLALVFSTTCIVSCGDDDDDLKISDNIEKASESTNETTDPTEETTDLADAPTDSTNEMTDPSIPEGAVDLGLSVKWASCNLGASKPEKYGDYYGWGLTEPYAEGENVTWTLYFQKLGGTGTQYSDCGTSKDPMCGYVYPYNKSIAGTQYDAAHIKLGGKWRMPTKDEILELIDNTTTELTKENGVKGYKVTSNVNGNSIFLPDAGCRYGKLFYRGGSCSSYWSATAYSGDARYAYYMYFNSDYFACHLNYRYEGQPVRPVSE